MTDVIGHGSSAESKWGGGTGYAEDPDSASDDARAASSASSSSLDATRRGGGGGGVAGSSFGGGKRQLNYVCKYRERKRDRTSIYSFPYDLIEFCGSLFLLSCFYAYGRCATFKLTANALVYQFVCFYWFNFRFSF